MVISFLHRLLGIGTAFAETDTAGEAVDAVGTWLGSSANAVLMTDIANRVIDTFKFILPVLAILMITIVGIRMVLGQEDDSLQKGKTVINSVVAGLILFWLIGPFIDAFYGTAGEIILNPNDGAAVFNSELNGLINWFLALVVVLAMLIVAITGLRAIFAPSSEEGVTNMRKALFAIIGGILLVTFRFVLANAFGAETGVGNPQPAIDAMFQILEFFLGFLGLVSLIVVIFAGLQILTSMGNEERVTAAKGLLLRALLGFVIIVISFSLVRFVIHAAL